jgi:hypothetical protein
MQITSLETTLPARHSIVRDTAKEIADFMRANPGCTRDDLLAAGFAAYQIDRFGREASDLAHRLSVRRLA